MDSPARPSQAKMASSTGGTEGSSPASSPASAASIAAMAAPKFGTLVPNRIFVGGISASTSEAELAQLFSAYGNVKATKIIADRGGVSKGYGFVTFETEEEAKRLQQESECIILRERKLNIAPAIKKQPFNRSFDGGTGSPPAVPTSTYYYTNGMGIPYQNGMTFYNAGAPAPGAAIAPPADPATLYQAAGVFGPQATASHQTYAPMMYPVPPPSLYMPQQYQYSPMPYEPYFPGTTATAGAPQYLYASNGAQATTSGSSNGSGNSSSNAASAGGGATGAGSPASASLGGPSPPQYQTHFYGPAGAAAAAAAAAGSHHHPAGTIASNPHAQPPPPPQIEHLYYSYPPPPHVAQPPHHAGLALAADQQLLIYSTDLTGQSVANDSQISQQEDTRSSSTHSEQLQQATGGSVTSDSGGGGGGGGGTQSNASGQPLSDSPAMLPLMPLKYPLSNRYANFHPVTMHSAVTVPHQTQSHSPHQQTTTTTGAASSNTANDNNATSDEANTTGAPVQYRTMPIYPTSLYIPHGSPYATAAGPGNPGGGGSLLPTPPQQPYDLSGVAAAKYRDYSKTGLVNGPYKTGPPPHGGSPLIHQSAYVKQYNGPPLQPGPHHGLAAHQKYPRVTTPPARLSYGKRNVANQQHHLASPTYYFPQKMSGQYGAPHRPGQQFVYGGQPPQLSAYAMAAHATGNLHKSFVLGGGYEGANGRRGVNSEHADVVYSGRQTRNKNAMVNSYRGSNLTMSATTSAAGNNVDTSNASSSNSSNSSNKPQQQPQQESAKAAETSSEAKTSVTTTTATTTTSNSNTISSSSNTATTDTETSAKNSSSDNTGSPPPASHSPQTRPHPNVSPSPNPNQVQQLFGPGSGSGGSSQRYNTSSGSHQQRGGSANRYPMSSSASSRGGGGKSSNVMRQNSGGGGGGSGNKFKINGIVQTSGKLVVDESGNLGGAGDAPSVVRLPITPPTTPQQTSSGDQQLNESCHQMQSLVL